MPALDPIVRSLAQRGLLPQPEAEGAAHDAAGDMGAFLGLVQDAGVSEEDLVGIVAEQLGMPGIDLSRTTIDLEVLDLVPRVVAESDVMLPLSNEGGRLHIAISAASDDFEVVDELRFITGLEVSAYVALPRPLQHAIATAYVARERGEKEWVGPALAGGGEGVAVVPPGEPEAEIVEGEDEVIEVAEVITDDEDLEEGGLEVEVGQAGEESGEELVQSVAVRVGPPKVLAVDDDQEILRLVEKMLRSGGYEVDLAKDGHEAEQKLKGPLPDLVLLDAMLPHVHGFELCARLKSSPRSRNVPVILMTAVYRGWRYAQDARTTFGADDYVEKPFHLPDLLRKVEARLAGAAKAPAAAKEAEALYEKGVGLLDKGKTAEARKVLELSVKKDPFSARAQFALGRALQDQGEAFHAITAYERAVELRPNLYHALRSLAALYDQKGFRRKSVEALERAVHAAPDAKTRDGLKAKLVRMIG